jgi:tetratricopeptide (TPR) repeat protein/DNA-binding MarR family transcriptional regulator/energy-coupling factor transporter ATP-binding protein EcfA2
LVAALVSGTGREARNFTSAKVMSLVPHKYTPAEMSEQELEATFAARGHTVEYLLKSLRDQIHSGTLSSFVITGPRGSGKSTVIQMVALRIRQDPKLQAAWLPVVFPEEQFNIGSLRDLMAATLQMLVKQGISPAKVWLEKVEAETNEEQSLQLAVTGLREVTRREGRRLILFIENLNQLLDECLNDQMKGTFRRLLMSDPFMMVIGSTVLAHLFDSLKDYDESFFNYFGQVMLDRLTAEEVFELLRLRAIFDGNHEFLKELPIHQSKIRAIVLLSGGNPRLILMLYELLTQRKVTTIVQCLTRLVDELTPLLKHEIENLPPQQRQIIHALMENGGTAQPTDLVGRTRLPLNAITTQLGRLKEAQFVEVLGGGKGRTANYTVSDKLFSVWYRMRYLGQNRRRIEMFVEVLRVWFEEEERLVTLRKLASPGQNGAAQFLRDSATTAEYFAASLKGTPHERLATGLCIEHWAKADLREAAFAYADLSSTGGGMPDLDEMKAYTGLGALLLEHGDYQRAIKSLDQVIAKHPRDVNALYKRGFAKRQLGDNHGAISDYSAVIKLADAPEEQVARALVDRGATKGLSGDVQGAISDCKAVIEMENAPKEQVALALFNRGIAKYQFSDIHGAISDYTDVIELEGAPSESVALALFNRGVAKRQLGDNPGAISDYNALIEMEGVPDQDVVRALFNRGNAKHQLGDMSAAISDYTALTEMEGVRVQDVARALVNRGVTKRRLGDTEGAISDWSAVIDMVGVPNEQRARAFFSRWLTFRRQDETLAIEDLLKVIDLAVMTDDLVVHAANIAYGILWLRKDYSGAKAVVTKLGGVLNTASKDLASATALRFLNRITSPGLKDAWAAAWRVLAGTSRPEVAEALHFLEPVCAVLEGKDRAVLDGLPPEQREFAENVLRSFEAKPN